ncbi:hypothetical protein MN116_007520 [Schistosoma mekongi]|uniref:Calponin-homology (CH) domain-containing protein n=1 Tax=Schistosoma mekongi TaxID=38744 RepID=A0AAE1Z8Z1_SCHME|nr:hypothetical protein MN116_007520 [Schistosoma mekongi]
MKRIAPLDKRYNLMSADEILSLTSPSKDIYLVNDKDKDNCNRLNLSFLASLFNMYPGLDATRGDKDKDNCDRLNLAFLASLFNMFKFVTILNFVTQGGRDLPSNDKHILTWVNEQLTKANARPTNSFHDPAISTGIPILQLLEHTKLNSTNKSIWLEGDSDDFSLCQYAVSCCRKADARVFTLPEHLKDLNGKMILTLFACLQVLYFSLKQKAENKQNRIKTNKLKIVKIN